MAKKMTLPMQCCTSILDGYQIHNAMHWPDSDRNIPDWVLKNRANLLTSMIKVYHGDLQTLAVTMEDQKRLAEKLYQIFETYLPVLQYGCHIFQRVPMLSLPKSATSIYMESMQILEHCRRNKGVLGAVVLYNNKIISTQLPPSLTSYLTVVDPYRIKSPAESLQTDTPLPLGAQVLVVYVGRKTYSRLKKQSDILQELSTNGEDMINGFKKAQETEKEKTQIQGGMKRDKSLLFTAVPEEDHNMISPPSKEGQKKPSMPDVVPFANKPRSRPNKISLNFKTQKSLDEVVLESENVFTGQTSVCSTPMLEYKRLHGNMLSICQNLDSQDKTDLEPDVIKNIDLATNEVRDKTALSTDCVAEHFISKPEPMRKLASVTNLLEKNETDLVKLSREDLVRKNHNTTINDPLFPVFRNDGVAISESLFNQYLEQYYAGIKDKSKENMFNFNLKLCELDKFHDFDSELTKSPQRTPKKIKDSKATSDQSRRKSLSLPLKSLNTDFSDCETVAFKKKLSGVQLTPLMEKLSHLAFSDKSSGYSSRVMTPLEYKDILTPSLEKQVSFAERSKQRQEWDSESESESDSEYERDNDSICRYSARAEKCALFVSGLHNMALYVLMDTDAANNADTINSLWETSLNALGPIEQKCLEPLVGNAEATDYSYLMLDPDWGTVRKGGPWAAMDIATMGLLHNEFQEDRDLTEFMLRYVHVGAGNAFVYYYGVAVDYCFSSKTGSIHIFDAILDFNYLHVKLLSMQVDVDLSYLKPSEDFFFSCEYAIAILVAFDLGLY
ncbi:unnamed protein product [Leptidea sinapis]|uniref:Uncharacterized protein n=1 Tax=Leptidea sinapis TaxID=189913 RepID=A0A5E4Q043_9NEOP|nr:unnamed protein product [Leptidea sinapis]